MSSRITCQLGNSSNMKEQNKEKEQGKRGHSDLQKSKELIDIYIFFKLLAPLFIYLFIFWLCWVFVSARGLPLVAASGGHSSSRFAGLSLSRPLLLQSMGSRHAGSVVVTHGPSCSAACGIPPDQGSNPCPLHWQGDSQPLRHQGSPDRYFLKRDLTVWKSETRDFWKLCEKLATQNWKKS